MAKRIKPERSLPRGYGWIAPRGSRFQARWTDYDEDGWPVERGKSFPTHEEAEDFLRQLGRAKRDGRYIEPQDRTVKDIVEDWLRHGRREWKSTSYASFRTIAERHIYPYLGDIRAVSVTTPRLQRWQDDLEERANLSPKTIQNVRMVLSAAYREAIQIKVLTENPVSGLKSPSVRRKTPPTWTLAETQAVLQSLSDEPLWHAVYLLALTTACRPGELRALKWSDLDLEHGTVSIRRTITRDEDYRPIIGDSTKTGSDRVAVLTTSTVAALRRWRQEQTRQRLAAPRWNDIDLVFTRSDGNFLPYTNWQKKHASITRKTGVKTITIHGLRHTSATLEMEAGTHPKIVQERLGHKHITTTLDTYSHLSVELQKAAAEALDERLSTPKVPKTG